MKVLVTGATGFLGGYVVDELVAHSHEVHAAVRSGSDTKRLDRSSIRKRTFDLNDPSGMGEAVRGMEAVVHLAAYYTFAGRKDLYQKLNVDATAALVDACRVQGVGHFLYCSSTEAIGPVQGLGDETSELHPQFEYGRSKVKAEKVVRERAGASLPWTIIRPSGIYGPGNVDDISFWTIISYGQSSATRRMVGSGKNLIQFVHAQDVARAFRLAMDAKDAARDQIYIVSDDLAYTYEEIYLLLSELKGVPPPHGHIPAILAKVMIAPVQMLNKVRGKDDFLMRTSTVDVLTSDRAYSIEKARRELGYEPLYDLRRGLEETITWYRNNKFL